jgi:hypothetical protein
MPGKEFLQFFLQSLDIYMIPQNNQDITGLDISIRIWVKQHFPFQSFDGYDNQVML